MPSTTRDSSALGLHPPRRAAPRASRAGLASLGFVAALVLAGCPRPTFGDAEVDDATDGDPMDPDGEPRGGAPLFAQCGGEQQCAPALGVTCLTTFPGGLCSRRCDSDAQCGLDGACVYHVCLPRCRIGFACERYGGACAAPADPDGGVRTCRPSCAASGAASPDAPPCVDGLSCDEYTGACTAEVPTTGALNGDPCREPEDCRSGQCVGEVRADGSASGFAGGYCVSEGLMPPTRELRDGAPIPRSNCPAGSAVLPFGEGVGAGASTLCLRSCASDGQCRPGYYCNRFESFATVAFSTGLCWPVDCSQPGRACAAGYRCTSDATSGLGVCARTP